MKRNLILAIVAALALPVSAFAQGTIASITWANAIGTAPNFVLYAQIYGLDPTNPTQPKEGNTAAGRPIGTTVYGGLPLSGTGFTVGLFFGAAGQPLDQRDTTVFRTGGAAGTWVTRTPGYTDILPGTAVTVQIRAWDNRNGQITSWTAVMADPTIPQGVSGLLSHVMGGVDPLTGMTFPVQQTLGLRSFQLTMVPEPSLIALGALGLGALLLRRRK